MKDSDSAPPEINKLIHKPPRNWRNFSQALIDASGNGLLTVDQSGIIFLANKVALERFNVQAGMSLEAALPELWPMVAKTLADGQRRMEISVHVVDREYLTRVSSIVLEGELVGAICVCEERSELEKVARQMRSFQEMTRELDAIIDSSSDGLFVCDAQANVIRINPASERIHKIKAQQVVGRNMVDLIQSGFIDRSAALEASRSKKAVSLLQTKDNRKLISTAIPVFDDQENLIRVVVSERDITEIDTLQRMLEEQEALKDQFRNQIMEMQQADLEARRIIARSPSMVKALQQALKVSNVNSSVLITGESGVGKGLIADLIHKNSGRSDKPLIKINCGAIPETLIESELFGYEKGAFTGA
ncbi:MAG: PAS domain-containing protein, partial [Proteobacteria bacterium]|nr:PAS domain-containing protein [Pseudomonadota bacterium]